MATKDPQHALERTELARERTVLAWQRNRLSEMTVLLGVVGVGIAVQKFYPEYFAAGTVFIAFASAGLAYTVYRYFCIKNEWRARRGK